MLKKIANHHITNKTKKILYIKVQILLFTLLPIVVFTLLASKNSIPGVQSFVVLTGSMHPTIDPGSVVYVRKQPVYMQDDVISFKNATGQIVTHRLVASKTYNGIQQFQTKGDANNTIDQSPVTNDKIVGKVVFNLPYLGYAISFLKSGKGLILAIILPSIVLVIFELWNIKKEIVRQTEERLLKKLQISTQ
jgi:signal peptidase I